MPRLIDFFGRRHRMPGFHRQKNEPFILAHHPRGKFMAPIVFPSQAMSEGE
jgi:hypothetical protein